MSATMGRKLVAIERLFLFICQTLDLSKRRKLLAKGGRNVSGFVMEGGRRGKKKLRILTGCEASPQRPNGCNPTATVGDKGMVAG